MSKAKAIVNGKIVTPEKVIENMSLIIDDGKFAEISQTAGGLEIIDAEGCFILPGFVDIHLHGGNGFDFMDGTEEAFESIAEIHCRHGTTSILPTTVACPQNKLFCLFEIYKKCAAKSKTAKFRGIHMEGPFITKEMKGAQNEAYIIPPDKDVVDEIFDRGKGIISRITAAPEIGGAQFLAKAAKNENAVLSIGHSNATADEVFKAYKLGFKHITHMYCSTTTNRKIGQNVYAGIVEAAYLNDGITVELIGDGKHIPKETMQLALKIKGAKHVALITDAMRASGLNCTESYLGSKLPQNRVIIEDGVAKLPDRSSFAGSIATSDIVFKNAVENYGISICDASCMMSLAPAEIIGIGKKCGSIEIGKEADFIFADNGYDVKNVFVNGNKIF